MRQIARHGNKIARRMLQIFSWRYPCAARGGPFAPVVRQADATVLATGLGRNPRCVFGSLLCCASYCRPTLFGGGMVHAIGVWQVGVFRVRKDQPLVCVTSGLGVAFIPGVPPRGCFRARRSIVRNSRPQRLNPCSIRFWRDLGNAHNPTRTYTIRKAGFVVMAAAIAVGGLGVGRAQAADSAAMAKMHMYFVHHSFGFPMNFYRFHPGPH